MGFDCDEALSSRLETSSQRENLIAMLRSVTGNPGQASAATYLLHKPSTEFRKKVQQKDFKTVTRTLTVICLAFIQGFFFRFWLPKTDNVSVYPLRTQTQVHPECPDREHIQPSLF